MNELQLFCTIVKKIESEFRKKFSSTFCSPSFSEGVVKISQLTYTRWPRYPTSTSTFSVPQVIEEKDRKISLKVHI